MTCDCNKDIYKAKEMIRGEMQTGFKENTLCHADMKTRIVRIEEFHKNAAIQAEQKDKSDIHMKKMLWSILTGILMIIIGAVLSTVIKTYI